MPVHVGANSPKKPHHIVILRFSEVVKGHARYELLKDFEADFFGNLYSKKPLKSSKNVLVQLHEAEHFDRI